MNIPADIRSAAAEGNLSEVLRLTIASFGAESGTLHMIGPDGFLHLKAGGEEMPEHLRNMIRRIPIGKGMAGLAAERKEPVTACNIQTDTSGDVRPGAKLTGMEGAIVVPVMKGEEVMGTLGIANRHERTFSEEETTALMEIGRLLALAA